jgi:hypothetical protein
MELIKDHDVLDAIKRSGGGSFLMIVAARKISITYRVVQFTECIRMNIQNISRRISDQRSNG